MAKKPKPKAKDKKKTATAARTPRVKAERPPTSAEDFEHDLRRLIAARNAEA